MPIFWDDQPYCPCHRPPAWRVPERRLERNPDYVERPRQDVIDDLGIGIHEGERGRGPARACWPTAGAEGLDECELGAQAAPHVWRHFVRVATVHQPRLVSSVEPSFTSTPS